MRQFVLLAACVACAAGAARAEDRFGPQPAAVAPDRAANERATLIYDTGAALTWSGKTQAQSAATSDIRTLQSTPLADGLLRNTSASPYLNLRTSKPAVQTPGQASVAPASATGPIAPAQPRFPQYTPAVSPVAPAPAPNAQITALPTSLFDAPTEPAEPTPAPRPRAAAGSNAPVGSRLYSVHAGYGMTADPIPLAQAGVGQ